MLNPAEVIGLVGLGNADIGDVIEIWIGSQGGSNLEANIERGVSRRGVLSEGSKRRKWRKRRYQDGGSEHALLHQ